VLRGADPFSISFQRYRFFYIFGVKTKKYLDNPYAPSAPSASHSSCNIVLILTRMTTTLTILLFKKDISTPQHFVKVQYKRVYWILVLGGAWGMARYFFFLR
jgi:hypothetical protein